MSIPNKLLLQQVRESYRFLFEYQSRILNLMSFIERRLGLSYRGGFSKFSNNTPRSASGKLDLWGWDWLNLYFYEFHFGFYDKTGKSVNQIESSDSTAENIGLSVFLVSDDGYFRAFPDAKTNVNRVETKLFADVEISETKLIFVAAKNIWKGDWWYANQNIDSPQAAFVMKDEDVLEDCSVSQCMILKSFNLEDFFDEASALQCLQEFADFCLKHKINMRIKEVVNNASTT